MAYITDDDRAFLRDISKEVQGAGRRIGSPKNDLDDLIILAETLETHAETLRIIKNTIEVIRNS